MLGAGELQLERDRQNGQGCSQAVADRIKLRLCRYTAASPARQSAVTHCAALGLDCDKQESVPTVHFDNPSSADAKDHDRMCDQSS